MRKILLSSALIALTALAAPTLAQAQNVPQFLQGMMTGNQGQDQKIREAYERGYQKGREDEAQLARHHRSDDRGDSRQRSDRNFDRAPYDSRQNDTRQNDYRR